MDFLIHGSDARFRSVWLGFLLCLGILGCSLGMAAGEASNEYELKAAFLYKFASFVSWPGSKPAGPLCIGVVGEDPFGAALDEVVKGKTINGRIFEIHRFRTGQEPIQCQILFISESERKRLGSVLDRTRTYSTLTVGDMPGFCENGGMIRLRLQDNYVRMDINQEAAEKAGLQLSSKLLNLARIVRPAPNGK